MKHWMDRFFGLQKNGTTVKREMTAGLIGFFTVVYIIAVNSLIGNSGRLVGPSIAGVVIAAYGEAVCFVLNAVSFVAVLVSFMLIRVQASPRPAVHPPVLRGLARDGLRARRRLRRRRAALHRAAPDDRAGPHARAHGARAQRLRRRRARRARPPREGPARARMRAR